MQFLLNLTPLLDKYGIALLRDLHMAIDHTNTSYRQNDTLTIVHHRINGVDVDLLVFNNTESTQEVVDRLMRL